MPKNLLILIILALNLLGSSAYATDQASSAESATYDLRQTEWGKGNLFELKGYWDFAWQNLVSSHDEQTVEWSKVYVPDSWDQRYSKGAESLPPLPAKGFGTYFVRILVPDDVEETYLHLPDMASAYELWYQGKLLGGNGVVGESKVAERPGYLPKIYRLEPQSGVIELYIKTSNYHYQWGGLWYAPKITDESGLFELRDQPMISAIAGGTILLMSAIFCLLLYASRPQTVKTLYFGLFCLAIGIRRLLIDERILYLNSALDWHTLQAIENVAMYMMLPLFLAYFREVFPSTTNRKLPFLGCVVAFPLCITVLFTEVEFYSHLNRPFQASLVLFIPIVLHNWYKALLAKVQSAKIFGLSLLILLLTTINDILHYNYIVETNNLMHVGALAFVLFQIAALMQRYLKNFQQIETLSESLAQQNKELLKVDKFKDDFLASTSHELRMPLYGIAGLAKNVRQEQSDLPEEAGKRIRLIESTAKRLSNIVNDILDIASIKHDKLELKTAPVELRSLIESSTETLAPLLKGKDLKLSYQIDGVASYVHADEQRLHQIFFNLLGNAIKFTEHGSIQVEAKQAGEWVAISIKDTGVGIPESKLQRVFQSFESFNTASQNEIRGTGLGLPITKRLIELHGGEINIDSLESHGTTVHFNLPRCTAPDTSKVASSDTEKASVASLISTPIDDEYELKTDSEYLLTKGARVFFVDDEEVNRELLSSQLSAKGYKVSLFASGPELLNALKDFQPELVLLDWMMPDMSGLEVCKAIREQYNAYELPIMMLTARHQPDDIVRALNAGANDYLTKPYHEKELIARVYGQISVKKLQSVAQENERLNIQVEQHVIERDQLSQSNNRLMAALDKSEDSVLLIDEDLDIIFANESAKENLQLVKDSNEHPAIEHTLDEDSVGRIRKHLVSGADKIETSIKHRTLGFMQATLQAVQEFEDRFLILIIPVAETGSETPARAILTTLVQEMTENRQRMDQIESALKHLNGDDVDPEHDDESSTETNADNTRAIVVQTLKTALLTWERHTHKNKAELAEQSRCWSVYLDGTTAKTRTLDKYLSIKTLPAKPRWRAVIKTAKFVLDQCEVDTTEQTELNSLINQLKTAYS